MPRLALAGRAVPAVHLRQNPKECMKHGDSFREGAMTRRPHALTLAALALISLLIASCGAPSQPRATAPAATQAPPAAAKPANSAPSAAPVPTTAAGNTASGGSAGQAAQPYRPTPLSPAVPVRLAQIGGASDAGIY